VSRRVPFGSVGGSVNGTVRWPENGTSIPLEVRAPGST